MESSSEIESIMPSLPRKSLFKANSKKDNMAKNLLMKELLIDLDFWKAVGKGDCFFDAIALGLNEKFKVTEYGVKPLRLLCSEYVRALDEECGANPNHEKNWVSKSKKQFYNEYLANIGFTVEEREQGKGLYENKLAVWGEQSIDGKILCEKIGINIHIVELRENPGFEDEGGDEFIVGHNLVTADGLKNVGQEGANYSDDKTIHIVVYKNHFVPILPKSYITKLELEEKTQSTKHDNEELILNKNDSSALKKKQSKLIIDEKIPSYDEVMAKRQYINLIEYTIHNRRGHHITLKRPDAEEEKGKGWKFHISIDDSDPDNVKKMWDVVAPVLSRHALMISKFSTLNCPQDSEVAPFEQGRHITIYCALHPEFTLEEWKNILEDACECLADAGIPAGYQNTVCKPVAGTNYVTYRNDLYKGEYKSCRWIKNNSDIFDEMKYNSSGVEDKFEGLELNINSELTPRKSAESDEDHNNNEDDRGCCKVM